MTIEDFLKDLDAKVWADLREPHQAEAHRTARVLEDPQADLIALKQNMSLRQAILLDYHWYFKTCLDDLGHCLELEHLGFVNPEDRSAESNLEQLKNLVCLLLGHLTEWKV